MSARGGRGGRGGARGGRGGAFNPNRVNIGGVELNWDLTGLKIDKTPGEKFPPKPPPQAPKPTPGESAMVKHHLAVRDRIHDGPFYTILNDGMTSGLKRSYNDMNSTEGSFFNPFTEGLTTYSSKYLKVTQRVPRLDMRPYVTEFFPAELQSLLGTTPKADGAPAKKRKTLKVAKSVDVASKIDNFMAAQGQHLQALEEKGDEEEEDEDIEEEEEDKPEAVDEDDNYSAASSDSEESGDDYNAEKYFDNGDDDDGADDGDGGEQYYE